MIKYNQEIVKIKLSSSFISRTLCKFCLNGPIGYICFRNKKVYKSPRLAFRRQSNLNINPSFVIENCVKYREFHLSSESFLLDLNMFNIVAHRTIKFINKKNVEECVFCECGRTIWTFNNKSTQHKKEVLNRKSKNFYPKQFLF